MSYFLLFRGSSVSPEGGMGDCVGIYATLGEADAARFGPSYQGGDNWAHIVEVGDDGVTFKSVWDPDAGDPDVGPGDARARLREGLTWKVGYQRRGAR